MKMNRIVIGIAAVIGGIWLTSADATAIVKAQEIVFAKGSEAALTKELETVCKVAQEAAYTEESETALSEVVDESVIAGYDFNGNVIYAPDAATDEYGNPLFHEELDLSDQALMFGGLHLPQSTNGGLPTDGDYTMKLSDREYCKREMAIAINQGEWAINVSRFGLHKDELTTMLAEVLNEHPEFFHVMSAISTGMSNGTMVNIFFSYYTSSKELRRDLQIAVNQALSYVEDSMTDVEKALVLHDYLVSHTAYAYQEYLNNTLDSTPHVYDAYGALVLGRTVCAGYAQAYKLLLNKVGIPCDYNTSDPMNHAWNAIYVNNNWYYVDCTWDDPVWNTEGYVGHSHFLASENEWKTELGYTSWDKTRECTSDAFKNYWWDPVYSQIVRINGKYYYGQEKDWKHYLMVHLDGTPEGETLLSSQLANYYCVPYRMSILDGTLLYSDHLHLYTYNLATGQSTSVYTVPEGKYILGSMVYENGDVRLNLVPEDQYPRKENDSYVTINIRTPETNVSEQGSYVNTTTSMEYSLDGRNWNGCQNNMSLSTFGNGTKEVKVWFRNRTQSGKFSCVPQEKILFAGKHVAEDEDGRCDTPIRCTVCSEELVAPGHASEVIPAVAPTCLEDGWTEGQQCSRCGVIIKEPLKRTRYGHRPDSIPFVPESCEENGWTSGQKCSVCGVVLQEPTAIPPKGHRWSMVGVTERVATPDSPGIKRYYCLNDRTHYREEEYPYDPGPGGNTNGGTGNGGNGTNGGTDGGNSGGNGSTDNGTDGDGNGGSVYPTGGFRADGTQIPNKRAWRDLKLNSAGEFLYYEDSVHQPKVYGFVEYSLSAFLVANGRVATEINGLAPDPDSNAFYYLSNGQVQTQYTGLVEYDGAWFYTRNGKMDTNKTGFVVYDGSLFYVGLGRIMKEVSGLAQDPGSGTWYFLSGGQVQSQYTGLAFYDDHWFYVRGGKLASNFSGYVRYDGSSFYVDHGMLVR